MPQRPSTPTSDTLADACQLRDPVNPPIPASKVTQFLADCLLRDWPLDWWKDVTVVVAVSGGPDSVGLLRLLNHLKPAGSNGRLVVAHFDHQWRDTSSEEGGFVSRLAQSLGLECVSGQMQTQDACPISGPISPSPRRATDARPTADRSENAARHARYAFLESVARDVGARYLVTGHTANDQVETVLHRIIRGTGLRGLTGIPRFRVLNESLTLARPLLHLSGQSVTHWLDQLHQPYFLDATNSDSRYTRNRIRHTLLPELREDYNPQIDAAVTRLAELANEFHVEIQSLVLPRLESHCQFHSESDVTVERAAFHDASALVIRELFREVWKHQDWPLQAMGFDEWKLLEQLAQNSGVSQPATGQQSGRTKDTKETVTLPGNVTVHSDQKRMTLHRESAMPLRVG